MKSGYLNNKKIVFFTNDLVKGGAEFQATILASYFRETHGAVVEFWGFRQSNDSLVNSLKQKKIPWFIFPNPLTTSGFKKLFVAFQLVRQLRQRKPDVILSFVYDAKIIGGLLWRYTGAKLFVWNQRSTVAASDSTAGKGEFYNTKLENLAVKRTRVFATNACHNIALMHQYLNIPKEAIWLTPNAIHVHTTGCTRSEAREQFKLDPTAFVVGMIAHYTTAKDHLTAVLAIPEFLKKVESTGRNSQFVFVGSPGNHFPGSGGNTYDAVRATCFELGLTAKQVVFIPFVSDIDSIIPAFDLGLLSSKAEGCPNALLQCMAHGLPVVGSDVDGIRNVVGEENFNYLFVPGDSISLADKMFHFFFDSSLCRRTGLNNVKQIQRDFQQEKSNEIYANMIITEFVR